MPSPKAHQLQRHHLRQYCFFSLIQVIEAALKLIKCNFKKKKIRSILSRPIFTSITGLQHHLEINSSSNFVFFYFEEQRTLTSRNSKT